MTYEWGYSRSAPMPVAPIDKVAQVVDFALTEAPAQSYFMGMPNYGYDWTLPYIPGQSFAQSLGNVQAVQRAINQNAAIDYDFMAQSPYYSYYANGAKHEVWFEDARSVQAKLHLAANRGLYGVSIWSLMRYFPQLWLVLAGEYNIAAKGQ